MILLIMRIRLHILVICWCGYKGREGPGFPPCCFGRFGPILSSKELRPCCSAGRDSFKQKQSVEHVVHWQQLISMIFSCVVPFSSQFYSHEVRQWKELWICFWGSWQQTFLLRLEAVSTDYRLFLTWKLMLNSFPKRNCGQNQIVSNVQSTFWSSSAGQTEHLLLFHVIVTFLSSQTSPWAWVAVHDCTIKSPMLSVLWRRKSPFHFLKTLFCSIIFKRLCQYSICSASLFLRAHLPCLVPVTWGARSPVASGYLRTIASSITHYKGEQERCTNTHISMCAIEA